MAVECGGLNPDAKLGWRERVLPSRDMDEDDFMVVGGLMEHGQLMRDLMGGSQGTVRLDPGNDDYWRHGQSKYVDLYNSAFMEPAEPNALMPAGW